MLEIESPREKSKGKKKKNREEIERKELLEAPRQ